MTKPTILILLIISLLFILTAEAKVRYVNTASSGGDGERTDAYGLNLTGTELIVRVDSRFKETDPNYEKSWLDGQIVDIRPMGFHTGKRERKRFAIIKLPHIDYWTLRGSKDWKSTKASVLNLKKYLAVTDKQGNYPWEVAEFKPQERRRDYFVDFRHLLDKGYLSRNQYFDIYDKRKEHQEISLNLTKLTQLVKQENTDVRLARLRKNRALVFLDKIMDKLTPQAEALVSSGTYTICASGCDYATLQTFAADIDSQLTGNLTAEHANEETSISTDIVFDVDTNGFLLKITAASGAEHNGTFGNAVHQAGDGARINYGTNNSIDLNETIDGDLDDVEISNLVFDIQGSGNTAFEAVDGGNNGTILFNRIIIKGDANSFRGYRLYSTCNNLTVRNSIIYDIGNTTGDSGINIASVGTTQVINILNNTLIGNYGNIIQDDNTPTANNLVIKNNLCQADAGGTDFRDDGSGYGTTAKNVSEDTTSPDASYREKEVTFVDEANDDFRLSASDTEAKDQGEDLSATFTDDIEGQSRTGAAAGGTWDIGADELMVVGVVIEGDVTIGP